MYYRLERQDWDALRKIKKGGMMTVIILLIIAVGVLSVVVYNGLISKKNQVTNAFGSIDTILKKRYDLIPNLVSAVGEYMKFERSVLSDITALRTKAMSANITDAEKIDLNNKLTKALGGIFVAVENYPQLKASENFLQLQAALSEVEEQVSAARRAYNAAVTEYNNAVEMFPSSFFASMMKYQKRAVFEVPESERANVSVKKLFDQR